MNRSNVSSIIAVTLSASLTIQSNESITWPHFLGHVTECNAQNLKTNQKVFLKSISYQVCYLETH